MSLTSTVTSLMSSATSLLGGWQAYLIGGAAVIAVAGGIYGAGYYGGYSHESNAWKAAAITAPVKQHTIDVKQAQAAQVVVNTVYIHDLAAERKLEAENAAKDRLIADLKGKVNQYVPQDDAGKYVTVGAISLLNDARNPTVDATGTPVATGIPDGEGTAPSTVTWGALVGSNIDDAKDRNEAIGRCNKLIDWVQDNVVNAPADPAAATTDTK